MAEEKAMWKCNVCGNSTEVELDGGSIMQGALENNPHYCCNKPMKIINVGG
ncbi:MAG: hypothetical protein ACOCQ4_01755 [bacterium]